METGNFFPINLCILINFNLWGRHLYLGCITVVYLQKFYFVLCVVHIHEI